MFGFGKKLTISDDEVKQACVIEAKAIELRDKAARPPSRVSGATGHG